jgi:hypothetical protein
MDVAGRFAQEPGSATAPFRICSFSFDPSAPAFSQLFCGHFVATRTDFFELSDAEPLALNFEMPV